DQERTMALEFKLPDVGEGVAEGEIVKWLVKVGDAVTEHQAIVEVMTDKATVEIPAPATGKITAINAKEGQTVPVGTVIFSLARSGAGEAAGAPAQAASAAAPRAQPAPQSKPAQSKPAQKGEQPPSPERPED